VGETLVRRPIAARDTKWAAAVARRLALLGVRPNAVSLLSVVCAGAAAACLVGQERIGSTALRVSLFIGAAAFIQLRLLCNLFDGMIAVEGGFRSKSGEIYNELPDRFSDAFVLVAAGCGASRLGFERELGWAAALLAVLTAYVRALGAQAGASQQFCGPMAKQQRMFVMTLACLLSAVEVLLGAPPRALTAALLLVAVGSAATAARRTARIVRELESR
jgi:phosphatidylglycerophosphate synthase